MAHPERLLAVLILATDEGDRQRVEGFAVRQESWALVPETAFTISTDWEEVLPELATLPAPEAWGSELARELVDAAKEIAPAGLDLHVNQDNVRAIRFYEKHGFAISGKDVNPRSGKPLYRMSWRP